jgi:hypothetical protein
LESLKTDSEMATEARALRLRQRQESRAATGSCEIPQEIEKTDSLTELTWRSSSRRARLEQTPINLYHIVPTGGD